MDKLKLKVLNEKQCQRIFDAAVHILNRTGVEVKNDRAKKLLAETGCSINGDLVTFSAGLGSSSDCRPELAIAWEAHQLLLSTSKPIFTAGGTSLMEQRDRGSAKIAA